MRKYAVKHIKSCKPGHPSNPCSCWCHRKPKPGPTREERLEAALLALLPLAEQGAQIANACAEACEEGGCSCSMQPLDATCAQISKDAHAALKFARAALGKGVLMDIHK